MTVTQSSLKHAKQNSITQAAYCLLLSSFCPVMIITQYPSAGGESATCIFVGDPFHPVCNLPVESSWDLWWINSQWQALKDRHAVHSAEAIGCQRIDPLTNDLRRLGQ